MTSTEQSLNDLVCAEPGAPEVVRALARIGAGQFGKIYEAVMADNPKLELDKLRLYHILEFLQIHGIAFSSCDPKRWCCTTLAHSFVWDEERVDWLPPMCLAISIIAESRPGTDIVKTLAEELDLDERQAKAVLSTFESVFRGPVSKWLASQGS